MTIRKVPLKDIRPNPWQARMDEDPAHVIEIAASIQAEGLLQNPGGRPKGDKVELCFGATRWAAFKWLAAHKEVRGVKYDPADYAAMPVDVRTRTDQEMFEQAIAENEQREDLSPIERATAIQRYMQEFGASRDEAGRLFGLQGSSVSNVVALLRLTPTLKDMVHRGELAERTARMFIHLSSLSPKRAEDIAKDLRKDKEADPDRIAHTVAEAMTLSGRLLMREYDRGKIDGKWWALDGSAGRTEPTVGMANRALEAAYPDGKVPGPAASMGHGSTPLKAARELLKALTKDGLTPRELVELHGWPPEAVERVQHLVKPPACTACEYRMVLRGDHYCAMKPCYEAKLQAYKAKMLAEARKARPLKSIPVYERKDGKPVAAPGGHTYYDRGETDLVKAAFKQALKDQHEDLRVRPSAPSFYGDQHFGTNSQYAELVAVGGLATAITEAVQRQRQSRGDDQGFNRIPGMNVAEGHRRNATNGRLAEEGARHFAALFGPVKGVALRMIGSLVLGNLMPWEKHDPDGDDEDQFLDENSGEPVLTDDLTPEQQDDLLRVALAERVLHRAFGWGDDPHHAASAIGMLAAPGGTCAGIVSLPDGWAAEVLAAFDRGEDPDAEAEAAGEAQLAEEDLEADPEEMEGET